MEPSLRDDFLGIMLRWLEGDDDFDSARTALMKKYGVDEHGIPKAADRPALMTDLLHVYKEHERVRSIRVQIGYEPRGIFAPEAWEFEQVEIDGRTARATATARLWDWPHENEYFLTRIGDRWYFNLRPYAGAEGLAALEDKAAVRGPREAARVMIRDSYWGVRAVTVAIAYGNRFLGPLREASRDFDALDNPTVFWVADSLAGIRTEECLALLRELWTDDRPYVRMVAAVGLAAHGAYPEPLDEKSLLVRSARQRPSTPGDVETLTRLAIIGLGHTGDERALPILAAILKDDRQYYSIASAACESLARLGCPGAIDVLRDCLRRETFWALPDAFRALIALGDRTAVPLAIQRIDPSLEGTNAGLIVDELSEVTGQEFGNDRDRWVEWWASVEED